jgi:hypothetical protein
MDFFQWIIFIFMFLNFLVIDGNNAAAAAGMAAAPLLVLLTGCHV